MAPLAHFFTLVAVVLQLTHAASTLQKRDLLSCGPPGGALYDPTVYTCYDDARLCPIVNGEPTLSRGMACYSEHMHSCTANTLSLLPPASQPFVLTAFNPRAPFNGQPIQACGQQFFIGPSPPCSYCPIGRTLDATQCAALTATNTTMYTSGLAVIVPGGQSTYWKRDGSLAFTQAHSASVPDLLAYNPVAYQGGPYYGPGNEQLTACPVMTQGQISTGNGSAVAMSWKVFARFQGVQLHEDCIDFYALVDETPEVGYSAWQYV